MKPDETTVVPDAVIEGDPQVEPAKEDKRTVKIDSRRSLSGQVDRFLKAVPEEVKADETKDAPIEKDAPAPKEVEAPAEVEAPEEVELDEIPEETKLEPLPDWQKYIIDNLPNIQVMGHQGENADKTFTVKRLEDLPDDFEFASKRAELAFNAALAAQEINARDLLSKYRQEEAQRSQRNFEALEAIDIQNDVNSLQKQGILPKFKYAVNDPRFNDDPAVQESNKIYDFYQKINRSYFDKYQNSGRMYRVSYEDAAYRYYALNPKEATKEVKAAIKEADKPKSQSQIQREKVAAQVSAPQGASTDGRARPLRSGTSLQNIYQAYKRGQI
jgi:hypothetical protein